MPDRRFHRFLRAIAVGSLLSAGPGWSQGPVDAPAAPVAVATSTTSRIVREVQVSGTVTSPRSALLSTEVGGKVARLAVDEGDRAAPDQVLLELDRELAMHALDAARAEVDRAEAALADARRRLAEGEALLRDRNIPQSDYESLAAAASIAAAELAAAEAAVRQRAAVLERHRLRAPFAGVISRRLTEVGEWVSPGTGVLELVAVDGLRFDFRVPQEVFPELDEATGVSIALDALPGSRFPGRIAAAVPVSDPAVRSFLLRVLPVDAADPAVTPGMSARATLRIDTGRSGVVVPRDALLRYPDGRVSVWVLDRSGGTPRVRERQVRLGLQFGDRVELLEGLDGGVPVVVQGNEALQDGQVVRVRDAG